MVVRLTWRWPPVCDDNTYTSRCTVKVRPQRYRSPWLCVSVIVYNDLQWTAYPHRTHNTRSHDLSYAEVGASLASRDFLLAQWKSPPRGPVTSTWLFWIPWTIQMSSNDPTLALTFSFPFLGPPLRCAPPAPIAEPWWGQRACQPVLTRCSWGYFSIICACASFSRGFRCSQLLRPRRPWQLMTSRAMQARI